MISMALNMQKQKKYIIHGLAYFIAFMVIFTIVDGLNMSYANMQQTYGTYLVITNITLNIFMSLLSAFLFNLSTVMVVLKGKEGLGSNFGFFSVLFGILTYGCTSCVIAVFTAVGIGFSVIALPFAGLPYKLLSLVLILIGLGIITYELKHGKCKVDLK